MIAPITLLMMGGRCADGAERDHGTLIHACAAGEYAALCGRKPGRRSAGWFDAPAGATAPTCPRCRAKMRKRLEPEPRRPLEHDPRD